MLVRHPAAELQLLREQVGGGALLVLILMRHARADENMSCELWSKFIVSRKDRRLHSIIATGRDTASKKSLGQVPADG